MRNVEYVYDDFNVAKEFVLSLHLRTIRQRFSSVADWKPDNCVLVYVSGKPVAVADCQRTDDDIGAICGLIARPDYGAYAILALLALKRHTKLEQWVACVRNANPSVMNIGRRFLDELYDQGAWEISNNLMQLHGPVSYLSPTPLVISTLHLKSLHLPPIKSWSSAAQRQILELAKAPGTGSLIAPSGDEIGPLLMTFAFELANTPGPVRQDLTRVLMFMMLSCHGINMPERMVRKYTNPAAIGDFQRNIDLALSKLDDSGEQLFIPKN